MTEDVPVRPRLRGQTLLIVLLVIDLIGVVGAGFAGIAAYRTAQVQTNVSTLQSVADQDHADIQAIVQQTASQKAASAAIVQAFVSLIEQERFVCAYLVGRSASNGVDVGALATVVGLPKDDPCLLKVPLPKVSGGS